MPKKLKKDILGFTKAGVGLGVGSGVVAGIGSKAGVGLGGGLSTVGGFMPVFGTTMMAKHTLRLTKKLHKKRRR